MKRDTIEANMNPRLRVGQVMSTDVSTLDVNDSLSIADEVMRLGRIRHMPVTEGEGDDVILAGIVSQRDMFRGALARNLGYGEHAQTHLISSLRVKEVMSKEVRTARTDTLLEDAAAEMLKHKIGCLVVVEDLRPVGILTEADFVKLAIPDAK